VSSENKKNNPKYPEYWDIKYILNESKWDIGEPTPIFVDWFQKNKQIKKILVPGAGKGHDAFFLAGLGHDVYALDFSKEATNFMIKKAKKHNININILNNDIFDIKKYYGYFDIILEYTFFCAILPSDRMKYIKTAFNLLNNNGIFVGILLPINKSLDEGGPPFGINFSKTLDMFLKYFKIIDCYESSLSIEPRLGNEKFLYMKKCIK